MNLADEEKKKKLAKLSKTPESRRVFLTANGNICVNGGQQIVYRQYAVICPYGVFWKLGDGQLQNVLENEEPFDIFVTAGEKYVIFTEDGAKYFSARHLPEAGDNFVLLLEGPICELYVIHSGLPPLRFLLRRDSLKPLRTLTAALADMLGYSKLRDDLRSLLLNEEVETSGQEESKALGTPYGR